MKKATLFYKSTCPPCRWMSRLVVILSLNTIRRSAISGEEAKALYRKYPDHEGQLVLVNDRQLTFGRKVFTQVPRCIAGAWWGLVKNTVRHAS